ncbi:MAG TPA: hypothetical protein PKA81_13175 [Clostridia bacterium]|nr:hypothetical protein [Clostridia bacterium]
MSKLMDTEKKIESGVVKAYKAVEQGVVSGYVAVEKGVITAAKKVENACVEALFTQSDESVKEAKERLRRELHPLLRRQTNLQIPNLHLHRSLANSTDPA